MPEQMTCAQFCALIKVSTEHMITLAMRRQREGTENRYIPWPMREFPPILYNSLVAQL